MLLYRAWCVAGSIYSRTTHSLIPLGIAVLLTSSSSFAQGQPAQQLISSFKVGAAYDDYVRDVAISSDGRVACITGGFRGHSDLPTFDQFGPGGAQSSIDIYVFCKDLITGALRSAIRLGGPNYDRAYGIALHGPHNNLRVVLGARLGQGFPTTANAVQPVFGGGDTANSYGPQDGGAATFVLGANGRVVPNSFRSTFFGPTSNLDDEISRDVAISSDGSRIAICGAIAASNASYIPQIQSKFKNTRPGGQDGYVAVFNSDLSQLLWARFMGGSSIDKEGCSVAFDANKRVTYITTTYSDDAPTTANAHDRTHNGNGDAYIARLSVSGNLLAATYVGGPSNETTETHNLALSADGRAVIAISSDSPQVTSMPTFSSSYSSTPSTGKASCYVAYLDKQLRIRASTFYGDPLKQKSTFCEGVAVAKTLTTSGATRTDIAISGTTQAINLPMAGSNSTFKGGVTDGFLAVFSSRLSVLRTARYMGGNLDDQNRSIDASAVGLIITGGQAKTPSNLQTISPSIGNNGNGIDGMVNILAQN